MVERVQHGGADVTQQLAEGGVLGHPGAHDHRVDAVPDQVLQLRAVALGDDRADRDVVPAGVPGQDGLERGEQHHEGGGVAGAAQGADPLREMTVDGERDRIAVPVAYRRALVVGGQLGRLQAGQPLTPVTGQPLQIRTGELVALPGGEVGVLHGQLGQLRVASGDSRTVEGAQLRPEDLQRARVSGDVVEDHAEQVVVGGQPEQRGSQRELGAQVDRDEREALGVLEGGALAGRLVGAPVRRQGGVGDLHRLAVAQLVPGVQDLVPAHQQLEGGPQRGGVQLATQPQGQRDQVLRVIRVELAQEPLLLLAGVQRERLAAVGSRYRGRSAGAGARHSPLEQFLAQPLNLVPGHGGVVRAHRWRLLRWSDSCPAFGSPL